MAKMECRCGEYLSTSSVPNDIELTVYFENEWKIIENNNKVNAWEIPLSENEVWICPTCKRIYVFDEGYGPAKKVYKRMEIVNDKLNILKYNNREEKYSNKSYLRVYTDKEWDHILSDDIIEIKKFPLPKYDVWLYEDCEQIYVFEKGTDNLLMVYELDE